MTTPRRILITGATRGLGKALAEHYLALGDTVVGCARTNATIEHPHYVHVSADVCDQQAVRLLMKQIRERCRGLDVAINNAGAARMLPLALTPVETTRHLMEVNFTSAYLVTHAAIRLMRKSACGRIVNFTSVAVPLRLEGEAIYAAAKSAVETLTRTAAKELGPLGITCNAVGPTPIRTDLIRNVPEDKLQALINQQAVRQWANPEDVANVIDFFLKPESRMITGQVIYLGGVG